MSTSSVIKGTLAVVLALLLTACPQPPPPATLEPPRLLLASAVSHTTVRLSWRPPSNQPQGLQYQLERSRPGREGFDRVGVNLSSTEFEDTQIPTGALTYTFRVRAVSGNSFSPWVESNPVPVPNPCQSDPAQAHRIGCFGPVVSWPVVSTFTALLPTGQVIGWYASDEDGDYREDITVHNTRPRQNPTPGAQDGTLATVWDPATGRFQDASFGNFDGTGRPGQQSGTDLFCAGFSVMSDGRFLTAGGNVGFEWGSIRTNIFDPAANAWITGPGPQTPDMWRDRWYPTLTRLPDDRVLITGGTSQPDPDFVEGSASDPVFNPCRTPSGTCPPGLRQGLPGGDTSIPGAPARGLDRGIATINARQTAFNNAFEIFDPRSGLSMLNTTAAPIESFEHYYPWWHVAPSGLVFLAGAGKQKAFLDVQSDRWVGVWESDQHGLSRDAHRVYGTSVMYRPNRVLVLGGGYAADIWPEPARERVIYALNNLENGNTSVHIELLGDPTRPPIMTPGPRMDFSRTHLNATLLADGRIFVNGGQQDGGENPGPIPARPMSVADSAAWWPRTVNPATVWNIDLAVHYSEIWTPGPGGGSFQRGPRARQPRIYHATSLLLPDATVLTAGGGGCGRCNGNFETGGQDGGLYGRWFGRPDMINQKNHEVYYPSYLFNPDGSLALRPIFVGFGSGVTPNTGFPTIADNTEFSIQWRHPDVNRHIERVSLVALGVPTHGFNQNQRFLELPILSREGWSLRVRSPSDGMYDAPPGGAHNIAPPGFYMLFLIDDQGVPSVAQIVRVQ